MFYHCAFWAFAPFYITFLHLFCFIWAVSKSSLGIQIESKCKHFLCKLIYALTKKSVLFSFNICFCIDVQVTCQQNENNCFCIINQTKKCVFNSRLINVNPLFSEMCACSEGYDAANQYPHTPPL